MGGDEYEEVETCKHHNGASNNGLLPRGEPSRYAWCSERTGSEDFPILVATPSQTKQRGMSGRQVIGTAASKDVVPSRGLDLIAVLTAASLPAAFVATTFRPNPSAKATQGCLRHIHQGRQAVAP